MKIQEQNKRQNQNQDKQFSVSSINTKKISQNNYAYLIPLTISSVTTRGQQKKQTKNYQQNQQLSNSDRQTTLLFSKVQQDNISKSQRKLDLADQSNLNLLKNISQMANQSQRNFLQETPQEFYLENCKIIVKFIKNSKKKYLSDISLEQYIEIYLRYSRHSNFRQQNIQEKDRKTKQFYSLNQNHQLYNKFQELSLFLNQYLQDPFNPIRNQENFIRYSKNFQAIQGQQFKQIINILEKKDDNHMKIMKMEKKVKKLIKRDQIIQNQSFMGKLFKKSSYKKSDITKLLKQAVQQFKQKNYHESEQLLLQCSNICQAFSDKQTIQNAQILFQLGYIYKEQYSYDKLKYLNAFETCFEIIDKMYPLYSDSSAHLANWEKLIYLLKSLNFNLIDQSINKQFLFDLFNTLPIPFLTHQQINNNSLGILILGLKFILRVNPSQQSVLKVALYIKKIIFKKIVQCYSCQYFFKSQQKQKEKEKTNCQQERIVSEKKFFLKVQHFFGQLLINCNKKSVQQIISQCDKLKNGLNKGDLISCQTWNNLRSSLIGQQDNAYKTQFNIVHNLKRIEIKDNKKQLKRQKRQRSSMRSRQRSLSLKKKLSKKQSQIKNKSRANSYNQKKKQFLCCVTQVHFKFSLTFKNSSFIYNGLSNYNFSQITNLNLAFSNLTDQGLQMLSKISFKSLKSLTIANNKLYKATGISKFFNIKYLNLLDQSPQICESSNILGIQAAKQLLSVKWISLQQLSIKFIQKNKKQKYVQCKSAWKQLIDSGLQCFKQLLILKVDSSLQKDIKTSQQTIQKLRNCYDIWKKKIKISYESE